jgi:hypothetical protein
VAATMHYDEELFQQELENALDFANSPMPPASLVKSNINETTDKNVNHKATKDPYGL